ncbi:Alpha/beta hydrolase family protein [Microlunatus sagamiharensis]|uniref:Alpha/beta hydrolase family protein n=1 Tax=Microlunatus sagamiharensis TaxID=546874 RepID=A0A1H2MQM4_9ACTN|nr:alpha/beta hydrolase [Microlunatus sagamiharensis]SDU95499.1 Alpha/beta hydrolase family protein [Microlunatus sagamiharensis]
MAPTTFVLLHGAGGTGSSWNLVRPRLEAAGHRVLTPDLPNRPGATVSDQAAAVVDLARDAAPLVLVAQSMGSYAAALAADRLAPAHLVLLDAMVPAPGESAGAWWDAVGQGEAVRAAEVAAGRDPDAAFDLERVFLHDVPPAARVHLEGEGEPAGSLFEAPFPLRGWPDVPTTVVSTRDDRLFPLALQQRVARERLGLEPVVLPGGHLAALSHPAEVAEVLLHVADGLRPAG